MRLEDFPRPPEDNGRGLHWSLSPYPPVGSALDFWIDELHALHIKWVKLVDNGKGSILPLAQRLLQEGMMPIVRLERTRPMPRPLTDEQKRTIQRLIDAGVRYIELDSEPDLPTEWGGTRPPHWFDILIDTVITDADFVLKHGGLPGIPPMELSPIHNPIRAIVEKGRKDLFEQGMWWAIHSYTLNRPLEYPDDPINRVGSPVSPEEYHHHYPWGWEEPIDVINEWRASGVQPEITLADDPHCFRNYELAGALAQDILGFPIPVISTEGGAVTGSRDDRRYPRLDPWTAAEWTVRINEFLQGSAPPWYFTLCHWLMAEQRMDPGRPDAWESHCWYTHYWDRQFGFQGELPVVTYVKAMPSLPRQLSTVKETPMPRTQVYGSILDAQGHPVGNMSLTVLQDGEEVARFTTTPDGRFHITLPHGGTYTLLLENGQILETFPIEEGQVQEMRILLEEETSGSSEPEEPLPPPGPPTESPEEEVAPSSPSYPAAEKTEEETPSRPAEVETEVHEGTIRGTLPGARPGLQLELSDEKGRTWEYILGEDRTFTFGHLPPSTYTLTLVGIGPIAVGLTLGEGEIIDIRFPLQGGIQGLVMGGTTDMVAVLTSETYPEIRRQVALSPQGQYRFVELPPGVYRVHVGEHPLEPVVIDGESIVTLPPLDLRPPHRAGIEGKVTDEQGNLLPEIPVRLLQRGQIVAETTTALNGRYTFQNLPEGEYQLVVLGPRSEVIQTVQLVQDETLQYNIVLQQPPSPPEEREHLAAEPPPTKPLEAPSMPEEVPEAVETAREEPAEPVVVSEKEESGETPKSEPISAEEPKGPEEIVVEEEPQRQHPTESFPLHAIEEEQPSEETHGEPAPFIPPHRPLFDTYILLPPPEHPWTQAAILAALPFLRRSSAIAGFRVEEALHARRVLIVGDESIHGRETESLLQRLGCEIDRLSGTPATWVELFRASARALEEGGGS